MIRSLEIPNLVLLLGVLASYLGSLVFGQGGLDLYYRLALLVFGVNIYLLKKEKFATNISRFALALVANFAIYSALLAAGGDNIPNILPIAVLWTFVCQIALFYIPRIKSSVFFSKKDYLYRIIVSCLAIVCNIILLFQLSLPGQFLFSLIFFYCGVELMVLYYLFQYLSGMEDLSDEKKAELSNSSD